MRQLTSRAALAAALVLAGCADGGTDPEESDLTAQEAVELATLVSVTSSNIIDAPAMSISGSASRSASAATSGTIHQDLNITAPCPLGGEVEFDGSLDLTADEETETGSVDVTAVVTHDGCKINSEHGAITLDGNPSLTVGAGFAWAEGQQAEPLRVTHLGGVDWARESGGSGSCSVNLVAVTDLVERQRTIDGTFCGFEIHEELTWTPET